MKKKCLSLFVCLVCFLSTTHAINQEYEKVFSPISVLQDVSDRKMFHIECDSDGYMWFASSSGMERYDGRNIQSYPLEMTVKRFVAMDENGILFTSDRNGNIFRYNELFNTFDKVMELNRLYPDIIVREMIADKHGSLWFGTANYGICRFDILRGTFSRDELVSAKYISNMVIKEDTIWAFGRTKIYILSIDKKMHLVETIHVPDGKLINYGYADLLTNKIFVNILNSGIFVYDKKNHNFQEIISISTGYLRDVESYDCNTLLWAVDGAGIFVMDRHTLKIKEHYSSIRNKGGTLGSNGIYDLYIDNSRRIWVATYTAGIYVYDPFTTGFNYLRNNEASISSNHINQMIQDSRDNIWVATNAGLGCYNRNKKLWKYYLTDNVYDNSGVIQTVIEDDSGCIWAGGFGVKLTKIDPQSGHLQLVDIGSMKKSKYFNNVFSLYKDKEGLIWAGSISDKLISINPVSNKVKLYNISTSMITEEDDNHLLLLVSGRIFSFNKRTGEKSLQLDSLVSKYKCVSNDNITCMHKVGNDLYLGVLNSGIIHYNYQTKRCNRFDSFYGIDIKSIYSIQADEDGRVWAAIKNGLLLFNTLGGNLTLQSCWNFDGEIFNQRAVVRCSNGELMFGTKNGIISVNPRYISLKPLLGKIMFTDISIGDSSIYEIDNRKFLKVPLNKINKLTLDYSQNSVSFHFTDISYNCYEKKMFSWILEGYDLQWNVSLQKSKVYYANLPPGKYHFRIKRLAVGNLEGVSERSIMIIIKHPWWNTIWAWGIYVALSVYIIFLVVKYYKNQSEKRHSEDKIRFFTIVSHDMRTPITLVKSPITDLLQDKTLSPRSRYLLSIANNNINRLYDMVCKVLDLEQSNNEDIDVVYTHFYLNSYIDDLIENFQPYASLRDITLSLERDCKNIPLYSDREKLDKIFYNLLSNAIKYSHVGGEVLIKVAHSNKSWSIEIYDTGIGIPQKEQTKIFRGFHRAENAVNFRQIGSGMGLLTVKNLVTLLGGNIEFKSVENEYTSFKVVFPLSEIERNTMLNIKEEATILKSSSVEISASSNILIVDDNKELCDYLSVVFSPDYNIFCATSAIEALNIMQNNQINIILTDIMMPRVDGREFCKRIKSDPVTSNIPVVLLSALSSKSDILMGLQIGADDYITKPFDSAILKQRISNILYNKCKLIEHCSLSDSQRNALVDTTKYLNDIEKIFIEKTERIINANINNSSFSLDILYREMGMSRSVFYNRIKNLTGLSPNDYMKKMRMERAAELLKNKELSIADVASMVGYDDSKYFATVFGKYFGCPPSKMFT